MAEALKVNQTLTDIDLSGESSCAGGVTMTWLIDASNLVQSMRLVLRVLRRLQRRFKLTTR